MSILVNEKTRLLVQRIYREGRHVPLAADDRVWNECRGRCHAGQGRHEASGAPVFNTVA